MKKIIVVDDSMSLLDQMREIFQDAGFVVEVASCGEEGIRVIEKNQDALAIIVDLNMPDITGLEMIERLGESNICVDVPKIVLTTDLLTKRKNEEFLSSKGRRFGIGAWFMKPVTASNKDHLIGVVEALLTKEST